jgi:leucyl aminopeptidase
VKVEIREKSKKDRRDALVVFATRDDANALAGPPDGITALLQKGAPPALGADGTTFTMPLGDDAPAARLYAFGIGKTLQITPRKARTLLRSVAKALEKNGESAVILDLPFSLDRMNAAEAREFLLRHLFLSNYSFLRYKTGDAKEKKTELKSVKVASGRGLWAGISEKEAEREVKEAQALAEVSAFVRDLGNTPSNDLLPKDFADQARDEVKKRALKELSVTVFDKKAIEKERMGGLLAVNRGSVEEPRFVIVEYKGGKKEARPVVLVGKGVTFDSGGISIKPAEKMGEMKWDMMGAATVLGILLTAADLKLPLNLVGLMALTENMPSGSAYKPGDIVTFRSGKTAEIDNTDAEGRVVLADALDYAKKYEPEIVLDYATLTGAAVVALGFEAAIVFTASDELAAGLISAGERTDDRLWRLPLWDEYKENIKSDWADVKNTGGRWGGAINGAMFLKEFAPEGAAWAHIDIAPTANYDREYAGYPTGSTAHGVAMTLRWLRDRMGLAGSQN